jgi:hypothetical protein
MTTQPSERHHSPDGRFWWDGTAWRPVDAPPPGPAPFQPPFGPAARPGPPAAGFPPPGNVTPRRPSTAGFVLALVCTLVGGLVGGLAGTASTEPPGIDTPPPFAAEFPTGERRYLKGVTLDWVVEDWMKRANSWTCTEQNRGPDGLLAAERSTRCTPADNRGEMYVTVGYDAADKVVSVQGTCSLGLKTKACTSLSAALVGRVLSPQGQQVRDQAFKWAEQNADSERTTIIGGVRLSASLDPHGMTATPAA